MGISKKEALEEVKKRQFYHIVGEEVVNDIINSIDTGEDKRDEAIEKTIAKARMETLEAKARINKYAEGCNAWYTAQAMFEAWSGFWNALLDIKGEKLGVHTASPVDEKKKEEATEWLFTPRDLCSLVTRMEALEKRVNELEDADKINLRTISANAALIRQNYERLTKIEERLKTAGNMRDTDLVTVEQLRGNEEWVRKEIQRLEGKKKKADKKRTKRPRTK